MKSQTFWCFWHNETQEETEFTESINYLIYLTPPLVYSTFQPQASIQDFSTQDFQSMNSSTMNSSTMNSSTMNLPGVEKSWVGIECLMLISSLFKSSCKCLCTVESLSLKNSWLESLKIETWGWNSGPIIALIKNSLHGPTNFLFFFFSFSSFWGRQIFLFQISNLRNHLPFNESVGRVISYIMGLS